MQWIQSTVYFLQSTNIYPSYEEDGQATGDVRFLPDNQPSIGAQSFMEDGEGDEANCNGGIFVDTGGVTVNGGFGGGGSGKNFYPLILYLFTGKIPLILLSSWDGLFNPFF